MYKEKEKERKRERDKRRGSTWKREGEKVPRWNCMRSKETELVLVLSFGVDLWCLSGRRYLASIPFATIHFGTVYLDGRLQIRRERESSW